MARLNDDLNTFPNLQINIPNLRKMVARVIQTRKPVGKDQHGLRGGDVSALEMSKPTYRELATNFDLWCKFVLLEEQVSEREFNEMSIDEKLDILQGCFGHEVRALSPPPPTAAVTPRLRSG